jgi:HD-GYP domain-containing protein (c-di-GMP phosphodiesterase class II)
VAWVGYPQQDADQSISVAAQCGDKSGYLQTLRVSWGDNPYGQGPSGRALRSGNVQINQDFEINAAMALWRDAARSAGLRSSISLPLKNANGAFAILTIYAAGSDAFYAEEISLLKNLAEDLSYGITSLRTRDERDRIANQHRIDEERLRSSLEQTVTAISDTLEMRDEYTAGHQRRVGELAVAISRELGLSVDAIHGVGLAAGVHDIGKIKVPSEILSKPGKLSDAEFMLIKEHAQSGYDILKGIRFPWSIADMVWQHHERMDGSGYPRGLKGEQILMESRILAVADVVEAMASYRPYRPALGVDAALREIARGRGTAYDAVVADACLKLFSEKRFAFSP